MFIYIFLISFAIDQNRYYAQYVTEQIFLHDRMFLEKWHAYRHISGLWLGWGLTPPPKLIVKIMLSLIRKYMNKTNLIS